MLNKVILIGNLVKAPEYQQTNSGVSVCKFNIAVNRSYTDANGNRETDFINIVTWRNLADNCAKYLTKGSKIAVCGSIQNRTYEDKQGNKRQIVEILAQDVEFLNARSKDEASPTTTPRRQSVKDLKPVDTDEDLPF